MSIKKLVISGLAIVFVFAFAARHHLVRANGTLLVIQKSRLTLHDTYVDVRGWTGVEWDEHQSLVESLWPQTAP